MLRGRSSILSSHTSLGHESCDNIIVLARRRGHLFHIINNACEIYHICHMKKYTFIPVTFRLFPIMFLSITEFACEMLLYAYTYYSALWVRLFKLVDQI